MRILKSWKQSLATLGPEPVKLLFLVTLKSWLSCLKELVFYWWWAFVLIGGVAVGYLYLPYFTTPLILKKLLVAGVYRALLVPFIYFVAVLCTRPSVPRKTYEYYLLYAARYFLVFLMALIIRMIVLSLWGFTLSNAYRYGSLLTLSTYYIMSLVVGFIDIFVPLFILFAIDRRQKLFDMVSSMYYAVKLIVYNFPLFFIISFVFGFIDILGKSMLLYVVSLILKPGFIFIAAYNFLWIIFYVCLYTNIYIKRVHEQPEIYFKAPVEE